MTPENARSETIDDAPGVDQESQTGVSPPFVRTGPRSDFRLGVSTFFLVILTDVLWSQYDAFGSEPMLKAIGGQVGLILLFAMYIEDPWRFF